MDPALAYFRKMIKETDDPLGRSLAKERQFICESLRVLPSPHEPPATGARPPRVLLEGVRHAFGVTLTLCRIAKCAARAESARAGSTDLEGAPRQERKRTGNQDEPLPVKVE